MSERPLMSTCAPESVFTTTHGSAGDACIERRSQSRVVLVPMVKQGIYQVVQHRLASVLAEREGARVLAYTTDIPKPKDYRRFLWRRWLQKSCINEEMAAAYADLCDEGVVLRARWAAHREAKREVQRYLASSPSRRELERFSVRGQKIGDLVYDQYIKAGHVRVEPADPELRPYLHVAALHAIVVDDLLLARDVCWTVVSSTALYGGVAARAAHRHGIPWIVATQDHAYRPRIDQDRPDIATAFRRRFVEIPSEARERLLKKARTLIADVRFRLRPDWMSSANDAAKPAKPDRRVKPTVLVAVHSFYDDPHAAGVSLFPDFLAWIEHLMVLARQSDYRWKFKLHPGQREESLGVRAVIEEMLSSLPDATVLKDEVTHQELLDEGVDLVLTVYGTIGFEYPLVNVPVLTAAPLNPHHPYPYCIHADSVDHYDAVVLNRNRWSYEISESDLEEYVVMRYVLQASSPFHRVPLVAGNLRENSGEFFKQAAFTDLWRATVQEEELEVLDRCLRDWIDSGEFSLNAFLADQDVASGRL